MRSAQPFLVDVVPAKSVIEVLNGKVLLHAGPPITWERMCGPMKGAVTGALIYEGLASNEEEAAKLAASADHGGGQ